jgi:hypothetical protein
MVDAGLVGGGKTLLFPLWEKKASPASCVAA